LVAEVGLGKAGIVMGLEVSRLARNCADWHRLLEICALSSTLILDEDGLYDPSHFNDRLLLGLKGTMSEAELHVLKARLRGGLLSKAKRGELKMPIPIGFVYDPATKVVLDPDQQVQQVLRHFFETFRRTGAAWSTVQAFRKEGVKFPRRGQAGSGEVVWEELRHGTAISTLHNPRYAGAFVFGRTRSWKDAQGKECYRQLPMEEWQHVIKNSHEGYLSWEDFEENQRRLRQNGKARDPSRNTGPPREGPALLQGMMICGRCGHGMTIRYHVRKGRLTPNYICQHASVAESAPLCQNIPGGGIDEAVGKRIVESVTPLALETVLSVEQELQSRFAEADQLRHKQVERAQYEVDQARLRYMRVDPNNRLVADTLETLWNEKLRQLAQVTEEYQKLRQADQRQLGEEQKGQIRALAADFPRIWNDPKTSDRDRKRMARLLIEDVTLLRAEAITVSIRFKGGAAQQLVLPMPLRAWQLRQAKPEVVTEVDRLLGDYTDAQIADNLNNRGWRSSGNNPFTLRMIQYLRWSYRLKSRCDRLREQGLLRARDVAPLIDTKPSMVKYWRQCGLLRGVRYNEKDEYLYERPSDAAVQTIKTRSRMNLSSESTTAGAV
jgi:DNA invertase Pin-like site-specific DNA recombinase